EDAACVSLEGALDLARTLGAAEAIYRSADKFVHWVHLVRPSTSPLVPSSLPMATCMSPMAMASSASTASDLTAPSSTRGVRRGPAPANSALPHDVWVDPRDRILVCDRENQRVELFDREGGYLGEWSGLADPMQIFI